MWKLVRFNQKTEKDEAVIVGFRSEEKAIHYLYTEYPSGVFHTSDNVCRCIIVKGALEHYYRIEKDVQQS